jgi:hypothetical protein
MFVIFKFEKFYQPIHFPKRKDPHTQNINFDMNVASCR